MATIKLTGPGWVDPAPGSEHEAEWNEEIPAWIFLYRSDFGLLEYYAQTTGAYAAEEI